MADPDPTIDRDEPDTGRGQHRLGNPKTGGQAGERMVSDSVAQALVLRMRHGEAEVSLACLVHLVAVGVVSLGRASGVRAAALLDLQRDLVALYAREHGLSVSRINAAVVGLQRAAGGLAGPVV